MLDNHSHNGMDSYIGHWMDSPNSILDLYHKEYIDDIVRRILEFVFLSISSKHIQKKMIQNSCMILIISI